MHHDSHEGYQSPNKNNAKTDPVSITMAKTNKTKSYLHLLKYALPYTLLYVFLPSLLSQVGVFVPGILLSVLVILGLNLAVIVLFNRIEDRKLEKVECHRIGLLTALLTLIVTSLLMIYSLYGIAITNLSFTSLQQDGVIPMLVISGAIGLAINYMVITYGLYLMQSLIKKVI